MKLRLPSLLRAALVACMSSLSAFSTVASGTFAVGACAMVYSFSMASAIVLPTYESNLSLSAAPSNQGVVDAKNTTFTLSYTGNLGSFDCAGYAIKILGKPSSTGSSYTLNGDIKASSVEFSHGRIQSNFSNFISRLSTVNTIILNGAHLYVSGGGGSIDKHIIIGKGQWEGDSTLADIYHSAVRSESAITFSGLVELLDDGLTDNNHWAVKFDARTASITFSGQITGNGDFEKHGSKEIVFAENLDLSSYQGNFLVTQGALQLKKDIQTGSRRFNFTLNGGNVDLYGTSNLADEKELFPIDTLTLNGDSNFYLYATGSVVPSRLIGSDKTKTLTFGRVASSPATGVVRVVLNGNNDNFLGTILVKSDHGTQGCDSILVLDHEQPLANGTVSLQGKAADQGLGILQLNKNATIGSLKSINAFTTIRSSDTNVKTLTLNNADDVDAEYAGAIDANVSIVKNGKGKQTFSGDLSAVNKDMTVNGGALVIKSASLPTLVNVGNGGSLHAGVNVKLGTVAATGSNLTLLTGGSVEGIVGKNFASTTLAGVSQISLLLSDSTTSFGLGLLERLESSSALTLLLDGTVQTDSSNAITNLDIAASFAGGTAPSWLSNAVFAKSGDNLYNCSYNGGKLVFSLTASLEQDSPSGESLTYNRLGGTTLSAKSGGDTSYVMQKLILDTMTDDTANNILTLNGVTLDIKDTLNYQSADGTYTIQDGDAPGKVKVGSLEMSGGTLALNSESELGAMKGTGTLSISKNIRINGNVEGSVNLTASGANSPVVNIHGGTAVFGSISEDFTGNYGSLNLTGGSKVSVSSYSYQASGSNLTRDMNVSLSGGSSLTINSITLNNVRFNLGNPQEGVKTSGFVNIAEMNMAKNIGTRSNPIFTLFSGVVLNFTGDKTSSGGSGTFMIGYYRPSTFNVDGELNLLNAGISLGWATGGNKGASQINVGSTGIANFNQGLGGEITTSTENRTLVLNIASGGVVNIANGKYSGIQDHGTITVNFASGSTLGLIGDATVAKSLALPTGTVTLQTDKYVLNTTDASGGHRSSEGGVMTITGALTGASDSNIAVAGHGNVVLAGNNLGYLGSFAIGKDATLTINSLVGDVDGATVTQSINSASVITFDGGGKLVFAGDKKNEFAYMGTLAGAGSIDINTTVTLASLGVSGDVTIGKDGTLKLKKGIDLSSQTGTIVLDGGSLNFTNQVTFGDNKLNITLNGGTINLAEKEGSDTSAKVLLNAGALTVTDNTTISFNKVIGIISVDSLKGDAAGKTLNLRKDYNNDVDGIFELNREGTFNGTVSLLNDCGGAGGREHFILRLKDGKALQNATVELKADSAESATNTYGTVKMELGAADVVLSGLKSSGIHNNIVRNGVDAATLTIKTATGITNTYTSHIDSGITLVHDGPGTQKLTGDLGAFDSVMAAKQGVLNLEGATNLGLTNAVTLKLDGGKLILGTLSGKQKLTTVSAGSGSLGGNLVLGGGTIVADYSLKGDGSKALYQLDGTLSLGTGDTPLTLDLSSFASFGAGTYTLKLIGAASLDFSALDDSKIGVAGMQYDNTSRSKITFDTTGNALTMTFKKQDPVTLIWAGTNTSHAWDVLKDAASWNNDQSLTGEDASFHTGDNITFGAGAANKTVTINGTVKPGSINVTGGNYEFTSGVAGSISGDGALTVSGGDTVVKMNLANASWNGTINLTSGELQFVTGGLGTGAITAGNNTKLSWLAGNTDDISARLKDGVTTGNNLALNIASGTVTFATAINNAPNYIKEGAGQLTLKGTGILGGSLTIGDGLVSGGTVELTDNGGGGGGGVVKGSISVVNGLLKMAAQDVTGWGGSTTSSISVGEKGSVELSGSQTFKDLVLSLQGGTIMSASGTTGLGIDLFNGNASVTTLDSSRTAEIGVILGLRQDNTNFNVSSGHTASGIDLLLTGTVKNQVSGNAEGQLYGLTKNGSGSLKITGAYEATGTVTVTGGSLEFNSGTLAAGNMFVAGNASIIFNSTDANGYTYAHSLEGYSGTVGSIQIANGSKLTLTSGNANFGGGIVLGSGSSLTVSEALSAGDIDMGGTTSSLSLGGTETKRLDGVLTGSGSLSVTGAETILSGDNSAYSGAISLSGGTLRAGSDTALGTHSVSVSSGMLDLNGKTLANDIDITGGTLRGGATSSIGSLSINLAGTIPGTAIVDGNLSTSSLALSGGSTLTSLTAGSTLAVTGATILRTNARLNAANLTLGTSLTMDNLAMTAGDALVSATGSLSSSGNVALNLSSDFLGKLTEGRYTIASFETDGGTLVEGSALLADGTEQAWDAVSPVYSYKLLRADDNKSWILLASINTDTKTWIWNGNETADWSDDNSNNANWQGKADEISGPADHAVLFGSHDDAALHTVTIAGAGVSPVYMQVETNATYVFQGGPIRDGQNADDTPHATTLMMSGVGTAQFHSANTFTGGTTLRRGTIVMKHQSALGTAGTITFDGGTLEFGTAFSSSASDALSQRFVIETTQDGQGNTKLQDLNLAVSEEAGSVSIGLNSGINTNAALLLNKYGKGDLELTADFSGSIHLTELAADTLANVRRNDAGEGGSLTLSGSSYNLVTVDAGQTLRINGASVTLAKAVVGQGTVSILTGNSLTMQEENANLDASFLLANSSSLNAGSGTTLAGEITLTGAAATLTGNGGSIILSGSILGAGTGSHNLVLDLGSFDLNAADFADASVNLVLGNGSLAGTGADSDTVLTLGDNPDNTLVINNLHLKSDASILGVEGQRLELGTALLEGKLGDNYTLVASGDTVLIGTKADTGTVCFEVGGGTLDLNGLALNNDITIKSGALANAGGWSGTSTVTAQGGTIDQQGLISGPAVHLDMGGLTGQALKNIILSSGSSVDNLGNGHVTLTQADMVIDTHNATIKDAATGIETPQGPNGTATGLINFATPGETTVVGMETGTTMNIQLGEDLQTHILQALTVKYDSSELLPDYVEPQPLGDRVSLKITNGTLDPATTIRFNPLFREWGLQIVGTQGGNLIVDGNLSVWLASKHGDITQYGQLVDYRAVYIDRDMNIALPSTGGDSDNPSLLVKYLSGVRGANLNLTCTQPGGTAQVTLYNGRDKDGDLVHSRLSGNLNADAGTCLEKTGEATLSIGGALNAQGSVTIHEGGLLLAASGRSHRIGSLNVTGTGIGDALLALDNLDTTLAVGTLSVGERGRIELRRDGSLLTVNTLGDNTRGTILLDDGTELRLAQGGTWQGTICGTTESTATLTLLGGTLALEGAGTLDGIDFAQAGGSTLHLGENTQARLHNWYSGNSNGSPGQIGDPVTGTLTGSGTLIVDSQAVFQGRLDSFSGTLKAGGQAASLTVTTLQGKDAVLGASDHGSLTLDYRAGNAVYGSLNGTPGGSILLLAGNSNGTNNTLTLTHGGNIDSGATLGFTLNTTQGVNPESGSLVQVVTAQAGNPQSNLTFGSGATIRLAAAENQQYIDGDLPLQVALANHVIQEGGLTLDFDQLFGKYFDTAASSIHTINGILTLTTAANRNGFYVHKAQSETASAGGRLLDRALTTLNPQSSDPGGTLACLLNGVDARIKAGDTAGASRIMAASAGSTATSLLTAQRRELQNQQIQVLNRVVNMGLNPGYTYAGDLPLYNMWVQGTGSYNSVNGEGDTAGYQLNTWGGAMGVDIDLGPRLTVGATFSASYGDLSSNAADSLTGNLDGYYVSLFGRYQSGHWGHTLILTGSWNNASYDRRVDCGDGEGYQGHAQTSGSAYGALYEASYDIALNQEADMILQPLLTAQIVSYGLNDYTETGAGAAGLRVGGLDGTTATLAAGARFVSLIGSNVFGRQSQGEIRLQVTQDMGDTRSSADIGFKGISGYSTGVRGAKPGATGLRFGAGLQIPSGENGTIFAEAGGDIRSSAASVNGSVGYRYNF